MCLLRSTSQGDFVPSSKPIIPAGGESKAQVSLLAIFVVDNSIRVQFGIYLSSMANYLFVRYLPPFLPSLLKIVIQSLLHYRLLRTRMAMFAPKRAFLLRLNRLLVCNPMAEHLACDFELFGGISIGETLISTILLLLPRRLKVINSS